MSSLSIVTGKKACHSFRHIDQHDRSNHVTLKLGLDSSSSPYWFSPTIISPRRNVMSEQPATPPAQQPPAAAETGAEGDAPAGPSKSELKKRAKEAEKAKKAAERAAREEEERKRREAAASMDNASQNYGKLPLHQSQERLGESTGGRLSKAEQQAAHTSSLAT